MEKIAVVAIVATILVVSCIAMPAAASSNIPQPDQTVQNPPGGPRYQEEDTSEGIPTSLAMLLIAVAAGMVAIAASIKKS